MLQGPRLEVHMDLGFDIFRTLDDGTPLWIKQVPTLDEGRRYLEALISATPGEYFVRDASTGEIALRLGGISST